MVRMVSLVIGSMAFAAVWFGVLEPALEAMQYAVP